MNNLSPRHSFAGGKIDISLPPLNFPSRPGRTDWVWIEDGLNIIQSTN